MSEIVPLQIETKEDYASMVPAANTIPSQYKITSGEFNDVVGKTNEIVESINLANESIAGLATGEAGKVYATLAEAVALNPKPANGVSFQVSATDAANAGYYSFQSAQPNGVKFERPYVTVASDFDAQDTTKAVSAAAISEFIEPITARIVATDNGFAVVDEQQNILFNVDTKDGLHVFGMKCYSVDGTYYIADENNNIAFAIRQDGKLMADLEANTFIKAFTNNRQSLNVPVMSPAFDAANTTDAVSAKAVSDFVAPVTTRIVTDDSGFTVMDEAQNMLFRVDVQEGLHTFGMKCYSVDGSYYMVDEAKNIAFQITADGKLLAYYEEQSFINAFNRVRGSLSLGADVDYDVVSPGHIFGVYGNTRQYMTALYPEALLKTRIPVLLDGDKKRVFQTPGTQTAAVVATDVAVSLGATGYASKNISVSYVKSNRANLQNKNIRFMLLGDSIVAQGGAFVEGTGGNIANFVAQFLAMDNADINNINRVVVGTQNAQTTTLPYNGSLAVKSFSEGRAGWATYGYLNYPKWVRLDGTAFEDSNLFLGAEAMYLLAGLATKTPFDSTTPGQAWTNYAASANFTICTTPVGRFKPDYNTLLWEQLKFKWGYTSAFSAYTGNEAACQAEMNTFLFGSGGIAACNGGVCFNPDNYFYDIARGQAYTGSYVWTNANAFSIQKYLLRYRTMDDLGVRLTGAAGATVTGSDGVSYTIGTHITNTNAHDVCTPSHFTQGLGTNDSPVGTANMVTLTMQLLNTVAAQLPTAKVGYYLPRRPGVFYPQKWNDYGVMLQYNGGVNADYIAQIMSSIGTLSNANRINFIPAFFTQSPLSSGYSDMKVYDLDDTVLNGKAKAITGTDNVHLSGYQLRSIGYQLYAWLTWTLQ
ncbi:hypothetical protein [Flavobacterium psychrotrophum]|uniref:hypothetical protein n=1 Tax=Flavobacterium psychrotrophum TaxID=2294119 RepID=UPI0013C454A3|nr:hypothetical protein [Flavobacterium psychrotrophum]